MTELIQKTWDTVWQQLFRIFSSPMDEEANHLYWLFWITFVVLSAFSYLYYYLPQGRTRRKKRPESKDGAVKGGIAGFFRFLFPKDVYLHPSAIVDYEIFITNRFVNMFIRMFTGLPVAVLAALVLQWMSVLLGEPATRAQWTPGTIILATVLMAMASDFSSYLIHMLSHKTPILWEFHKLHHTAEVLTPVTLFRKHPLYDLISQILSTPIIGVVQGVLLYFFVGKISIVSLWGSNMVYGVFRFMGANLRHSHVWLSWGPVFSRIFISPAQHQIHHSVDFEQQNTNYGEIFALWDWMFGSLYVPKGKEEIVFGVEEGVPQEHTTLLKAYYLPFVQCARVIAGWLGRKPAVQPSAEDA